MLKLKRIELDIQEYNNLLEFMSRVTMKGQESKAYVMLMKKIESSNDITELEKEEIDELRK